MFLSSWCRTFGGIRDGSLASKGQVRIWLKAYGLQTPRRDLDTGRWDKTAMCLPRGTAKCEKAAVADVRTAHSLTIPWSVRYEHPLARLEGTHHRYQLLLKQNMGREQGVVKGGYDDYK